MSGFLSVLDTRKKEWQERKRWWIQKYGIQSELGRENTISKSRFWDDNIVSVFDATLCENIYTSFIPPSGSILDPFAGGSVRGIVAEELGFKYTGIELSKEQVDANKLQSNKPNWICGDSEEVLDTLQDQYDLVFTCPPYHDLEIYSDNPNDLSNMGWDTFLMKYKSIIQKSYDKLKDNRFFIIVVSEIRDRLTTGNYKIGKYKGFVPSTIRIVEECGFHYYNDVVLINGSQQAGRMSNLYFNRNRKIASTHQNVLMFVKGNPDLATEDIQWDGTYVCEIDNTKYKSYKEASITIGSDLISAGEIKRRCNSTKFKYKNYKTMGIELNPIVKYKIGNSFFESIPQIANIFKIEISQVRSMIDFTKLEYRHWSKLDMPILNLTYTDLENSWKDIPALRLKSISCGGIEFYNTKDASEYYNLSEERIRQKLKSNKFQDYFYL